MNNDIINALFELGMAFVICMSIRNLVNDKQVKGISLWMVVFPTVWGLWNIYYYPSLGQSYSFYAGVIVVIVNAIYLKLLYQYRKN